MAVHDEMMLIQNEVDDSVLDEDAAHRCLPVSKMEEFGL